MVLGIRGIEESSTYQAIFAKGYAKGWAEGYAHGYAEGRLAQVREVLLKLGIVRFGPPGPTTIEAIQAMTDADRIKDLTMRLLNASSWDDLMTPVTLT